MLNRIEKKNKSSTEKKCINLSDSEEEYLDIEETNSHNYSVNTQKLCNPDNSLKNPVVTAKMMQELARERHQLFNFLMSGNYPVKIVYL